MRRLLLKSILFAALTVTVVVLINWVAFKTALTKSGNACYLWGDSQMCQGIDLSYLNAHSSGKFYSSAQHGAGVYDFLVFTEAVPDHSVVIIPIPHMVLIRRKAVDRNESFINLASLRDLYHNNYSLAEILKIIDKNLRPHQLFHDANKLYEGSSFSPDANEPVTMFNAIYSKKPAYFDDKKKLYLDGLKRLVDKKCTVVAIDLPLHPQLRQIEAHSSFAGDIERFRQDVQTLLKNKETINIASKVNLFRDYTHLNEVGAGLISGKLVDVLSRNRSTAVDCVN